MVDGLEDVLIQPLRLLTLEWVPHEDKCVSQALDTDTDGSMAKVGVLGLRNRIVVAVDDPVEVLGNHLGHIAQSGMIKFGLTAVVGYHEAGQCDRCQVTHSNFIRSSVFDDLRAQIAGSDSSQVLLVALPVAGILVDHVWRSGLDLCFKDGEPQLPCVDDLPRAPLVLILLVQGLKFLAPAVGEPRRLVGAEERPLAVGFDPLHEKVRCPQRVEEIPGSRLLFSMVFSEVDKVEDVCMPRLQVDCECTLSLAAALVNIPRGVVEDAQHRHNAI
mmetsp:Transcript_1050/g.3271  ORF Transcript_1050/g.3271 Transcript_1050/m.3271 type:complete len:273 (-) Transcript_1050:81-899(-)